MKALELKIPPPVVGLVAAAAMWGIDRAEWTPSYEFPGRRVLALTLAVAGLGLAGAGVIEFRRARTTVNPLRPSTTSSLVASGVYRVTRNPMYVGFLLVLLGWAAWLANPATLVIAALFVLYLNRFQITPEERALHALFGAEFETYRGRVRRWLWFQF